MGNKIMILGKRNRFIKHYEDELAITNACENNPYLKNCDQAIRQLLTVVDNQPWGGGAPPLFKKTVIETIQRALNFEPLTSLNRDTKEWKQCTVSGDYQNVRDSGAFCKDVFKGPFWYIHALTLVCNWSFDVETELMEYPESDYGFNGQFWMIMNGEWKCFSSGCYIRNIDNFCPTSERKGFVFPIIEFKDTADPNNDYICNVGFEEFWNSNIQCMKTYRLREVHPDNEEDIKKFLMDNTVRIMKWKKIFLNKYLNKNGKN